MASLFSVFSPPSRKGDAWFCVGLVSTFPDITNSSSASLSEQRSCAGLDSAPGCVHRAFGLTRNPVSMSGGEGHAALLMIGWTSVEAHLRFKTTRPWQENIHLVRAPGAAVEMHHVEFALERGRHRR